MAKGTKGLTMLELNNISAGYGQTPVVENISFHVKRHELSCIIGPNGSGKTTLLRTAGRIIHPISGNILIDGTDIWKIPAAEFALKTAVVTQQALPDDLYVKEYVELGRIPHHHKTLWPTSTTRDMDHVRKSLEMTDTKSISNRRLSQLSAGQRQMVKIARALAQSPSLLLLDEPTTNLDIGHANMVMELVKDLNQNLNITVLMVVHDLNLASEFAHNILLISEGKTIKTGTPEQVLTAELISRVYNTKVAAIPHPATKNTCLLPYSDR